MAADTNPTGEWTAALQKAQADLMRQWTDMTQAWARTAGMAPTGGPAGPAGGAGTGGLGSASGAGAGAGNPAAAADQLSRLFLKQCEQYLGVAGSLWDLVRRSSAAADPEQRARQFTDGLSGLQQQFASMWAATPFGGATGAGAGPASMFNPAAWPAWPGAAFGAAMPGAPGMAGMGMPPGMPGMPGMSGMPGMGAPFNVPALGLGREQQESWQRLSQLTARYAQAQLQVGTQWNEIIGKALRELGERLAPRLKSGAPPGSMKEIYDLWVDSAEGVYAQAARGAAFAQAQAELTNSMSQLRSAQRELLEEWARQFDLPTRAELNSIHQQLRELKAALAASRG